jgi:putative transposase
MNFASWKERRAVAAALKPVYQAESAVASRERLEDIDHGPWVEKYPTIAQSWRRNWEQVIPFFAFAPSLEKSSTPPMRSRVLMLKCARRYECAAIFPGAQEKSTSFVAGCQGADGDPIRR